MKYLLILLLLVACTPQFEELTEEEVEIQHDPLPRENPVREVEPEAFVYDEWYGVPGGSFLVSDGEKAARLFLPQGKSVELPLAVDVKLEAIAIDDKALIKVNGVEKILSPKEEFYFENGQIIVYLDDIIVKK